MNNIFKITCLLKSSFYICVSIWLTPIDKIGCQIAKQKAPALIFKERQPFELRAFCLFKIYLFMAENKKSFILYSDNKSIIDLLTNEQAGLLLKTLFSYVNDENPQIDDSIVLVFEMIKLQLKRDLKKWETTKEGRSAAGKASAEARRIAKLNEQNSTNSTNVDFVQQYSTNPTVNVSVSDSVNVSDIKEENTPSAFSFYQSLINLGANKQLVSDWIKVRKNKRLTNTETAFNKFVAQLEKSGYTIDEVLEKCVEKSWGGFDADWHSKEKKLHPNGIGKTNQKLMTYDD